MIKVSPFRNSSTKHNSMMSWNLTAKKPSTDSENRVWYLMSCSFTYQFKKIRFKSPLKKNHMMLLSKIKLRNFFNNKSKNFIE